MTDQPLIILSDEIGLAICGANMLSAFQGWQYAMASERAELIFAWNRE
jgi:hypothetical protein